MRTVQFLDSPHSNPPHTSPPSKGKINSVTRILRNAGKKLVLISSVALFAATGAQASPQYQYNAANQLAKVTLEDGTIIENFYDGLGNLVRQAVDGNSRDIILNELAAYPTVIGVVPTSGDTERVAYGPDGAVADRSGSDSTRYLVKDQLGTIKANADNSGDLQGRQALSAYGVPRGDDGEGSVLGYTGEYVDESGLVYLRARHYNPAIARFVQKDSYEGHGSDPASMNNYSYVHNNPLSNTDPSGHIVCGGACIGGLIVAGVGLGLMAWDAYKQHKRNNAYQAWKKQQIASGQWGDGNNASRYTPDSEGAPLDDVAHGLAMEALAPFASKLSKTIQTPAKVTQFANDAVAKVSGIKLSLPKWCKRLLKPKRKPQTIAHVPKNYRVQPLPNGPKVVISGHGMTQPGKSFRVPNNTYIVFGVPPGANMTDTLGNAMELGQLGNSPVMIFPPGSLVPDTMVYPPIGLNLKGNPLTVGSKTPLSEIVRNNNLGGNGNVICVATCQGLPKGDYGSPMKDFTIGPNGGYMAPKSIQQVKQ